MIAQDDEYLTSAVKSMYLSNEDYNVIKVARERDDFLRSQAYKDRRLAEQADEILTLKDRNAELNDRNAELNNENTLLSEKIEQLRRKLEENGIEV